MTHFASGLLADTGKGFLRKTPHIIATYPYSCAAWIQPRAQEVSSFVVVQGYVCNTEDATGLDTLRLMYVDDQATFRGVMSGIAGESTNANYQFQIHGGTFGAAITFPAVALGITTSSRSVYMNADPAPATNATLDVVPVTPDKTEIGSTSVDASNNHFEGELYQVAVWNQNIGELVARQIMLGAHPFFTRPVGLIAFLPLHDPQCMIDWMSATNWTRVGTPAVFDAGGNRPWQFDHKLRMDRVYGRTALARQSTGRTVVGW